MASLLQRLTRSNVGSKHMTLCVVFQSHRTDVLTGLPHHLPLLNGVISAATARRRRVLLAPVSRWNDAVVDVPQAVDGFLLLGPSRDCPLVPLLTRRGVPFVIVHRESYFPTISRVDIDEEQAFQDLVTYLVGCGHQRILFIHWGISSDIIQSRWRGCQEGLAASGLTPEEPLLLTEGSQSASDLLRSLMCRPDDARPTALVCANDVLAQRMLAAASDLGVAVPQELSVVGFDDTPESALSTPPLTTVAQPFGEMGALAARRLIAEIEGEAQPGERFILPTLRVERRSVAVLSGVARSQAA